MCLANTIYVAASLLLTLTFLGVGISFFGPYWISNLGRATNESRYASPDNEPYLPLAKVQELYNRREPIGKAYPDRGLWAQCGPECVWFWTDDFRLQKHLLTPLGKYDVVIVKTNEF